MMIASHLLWIVLNFVAPHGSPAALPADPPVPAASAPAPAPPAPATHVQAAAGPVATPPVGNQSVGTVTTGAPATETITSPGVSTYSGYDCVVVLTDPLGNQVTFSPGPLVGGSCDSYDSGWPAGDTVSVSVQPVTSSTGAP